MKIYLIRHSESIDDIENCYGGIADFDLTENGKDNVHKSIFKNILNVDREIEEIDDVATTLLEYDNGKFNIIETRGIKLGKNIR